MSKKIVFIDLQVFTVQTAVLL